MALVGWLGAVRSAVLSRAGSAMAAARVPTTAATRTSGQHAPLPSGSGVRLVSTSVRAAAAGGAGKGPYKAVIFDLGGVVLTPGPLVAIRAYEDRLGVKRNELARVFGAGGHEAPFYRLERGELHLGDEFFAAFEARAAEHGLKIDARELFAEMVAELGVNPNMLRAIQALRSDGIKVAALTNNWLPQPEKMEELKALFDVFVESARVGLRKPDPAIYKLALEELGVEGSEAVFLDDIGANVKAAKAVGMAGIKVTQPLDAIRELEGLVGVQLRGFARGTSRCSEDEAKLEAPLVAAVTEALGLPKPASTVMRTFEHGQSNPTFFLQIDNREFVVRKKPPGKLIPTAHAVDREYKIMAALANHSDVPVADPLFLSMDESAVGTPFYVMNYINGIVLKDPALPGLEPAHREHVYTEMARVLASLHAVDIDAAGLGDFGKRSGFLDRQIKQWSGQYAKGQELFPVPAMEHLAEWLPNNMPKDPDTTVVHGDFRLDNMIFGGGLEVLAVLDWELSTLGDPMVDLAYSCLPYYLPAGIQGLPGLVRLGDDPGLPKGVPTEDEYLAAYFERRGLPGAHLTDDFRARWAFYMAFVCFRVGGILQGISLRSIKGQSSSPHAKQYGSLAQPIAEIGQWLAQGQSADFIPQLYLPRDAETKREASKAAFASNAYTTLAIPATASPEERERCMYELKAKLSAFISEHVYPAEQTLTEHSYSDQRWTIHPLHEDLKEKAKEQGLWNLFLPLESDPGMQFGAGLTNVEYAELCEIMGRSLWAPEVFNCSAPDTGNMEVLVRYGTPEQQKEYLEPLLRGETRSCFAMTEPAVASSDATNITASIERHGDSYGLNGRKWWTSGAMDPRCSFAIFMGKTDVNARKHQQQSMVICPLNLDGVNIIRPLKVFGFDDAPHGHAEIVFDNVTIPASNMLLGEGRGFEIAQGRLGPGRIHHCMRLLGMGERAHELMCTRVNERVAFGKPLARKGTIMADVARNRMDLDQCRLLTMHAAHLMDTVGNKKARKEIAMIKVVAPTVVQDVIDRAMQAHGAQGLCQDLVLAHMYAWARVLRLADGPDEVHRDSIAKMELSQGAKL